MGEKEVKRVPVVGDTWHWSGKDYLLTSVRVQGDGFCVDHGKEFLGTGRDGTFFGDVSFVRSAAPLKEREWSTWAPPRVIGVARSHNEAADVAACVAAKPGQVYAARWGTVGDQWRVWRCGPESDFVLAGRSQGGEFPRNPGGLRLRYDHSVLVADVGCEPTPPEVLYGKPVAHPMVEIPGQTAAIPQVCSRGCGGTGTLFSCRNGLCRSMAQRDEREQGVGLAARFAQTCKLVACGHRACVPKSDEPWRSNFDDADLLGRDV